jgi:hypothetical protein
MSSAFVIEIEDQTAGLVLSDKGGFIFRASNPIFRQLEGRLFQHVRQARSAAATVWRQHRQRRAAQEQAVPPQPLAIGEAPAQPAAQGGHHYVRRATGT